MELKDAYKAVLKDIISNGPEMFVGKYDARNGNQSLCMAFPL